MRMNAFHSHADRALLTMYLSSAQIERTVRSAQIVSVVVSPASNKFEAIHILDFAPT